MSLLPFLVVATVGAVLALILRPNERAAAIVGGVALLASLVAALTIVPGQTVVMGGSGIATTEFLRLYLVLAAAIGVLLVVVGDATSRHRDAPAVTLGILATSGLALALPDPRIAVLAATAGGAVGTLIALGGEAGRSGASVAIRGLRAVVIAGTMAIAATAWIGRDLTELAAQPIVFGLAYLAVALAVAVRFGVIPFHAWAARLSDATPETTLPLVTAIAPAAFAVVALAWTDASVAPLLVDLGSVRVVVLIVAIASILLAALAAVIQDDVEHLVGYAIIGDAAVVLLAIAALDPEAWAPARTWILAFVVARSAFAAWAAATRAFAGTGRIDELRGWALRSPLLAIAFVGVVVASVGLPGLAAFDARVALVDLAMDGPLVIVVTAAAILAPLVSMGRLAIIGVGRGGPTATTGPDWRPTWTPPDVTDLLGWARRTWGANRRTVAAGGSIVLAVLAVVVSFGGFGAADAAAGLPPTLEGVTESFAPDGPVGSEVPVETDVPSSDAPSVVPSDEPSGAPSDEPSFEPVPTT